MSVINGIKNMIFGLIDGNSFFASCEQVFRPELKGKPVVVLSNNDGCIVALSKEAKAAGIVMGQPAYLARPLLDQHRVTVFSANHALYADFSSRLIALYRQMFSQVHVYSIDEAFVVPDPALSRQALVDLGEQVYRRALQWVGVPVSVGFGATRTLAKVANHLAKGQGSPVFVMPDQPDSVLETFPVGKVWGIGWRSAQFLMGHGVYTAGQFSKLSPGWVQKNLTVQGARTQLELQGITSGVVVRDLAPKSILSSRSFGKKLDNMSSLKGALTQNLMTAVTKLRASGLVVESLSVFFSTGRHDPVKHRVMYPVPLDQPTQSLFALLQVIFIPLPRFFKAGYRYARSGVILQSLHPDSAVPQSLFEDVSLGKPSSQLNQASELVATINQKWGKTMIFPALALQGKSDWKTNQRHRSPRYTTQWAEVFVVAG